MACLESSVRNLSYDRIRVVAVSSLANAKETSSAPDAHVRGDGGMHGSDMGVPILLVHARRYRDEPYAKPIIDGKRAKYLDKRRAVSGRIPFHEDDFGIQTELVALLRKISYAPSALCCASCVIVIPRIDNERYVGSHTATRLQDVLCLCEPLRGPDIDKRA